MAFGIFFIGVLFIAVFFIGVFFIGSYLAMEDHYITTRVRALLRNGFNCIVYFANQRQCLASVDLPRVFVLFVYFIHILYNYGLN